MHAGASRVITHALPPVLTTRPCGQSYPNAGGKEKEVKEGEELWSSSPCREAGFKLSASTDRFYRSRIHDAHSNSEAQRHLRQVTMEGI